VNDLGEFLRARRGARSPGDVGLPAGGRRRVQGLRRDEVARLVAVSERHYARIEQGRRQASEPVLRALAGVLDLDADERDHLWELAGRPPSASPDPGVPDVTLSRLLGDLRTSPAVLIGPRTDVLAWNPMAAALFLDFAELPVGERNFVRLIFTDARLRDLYADWTSYAQGCVAQLRHQAAHTPDDPRLADLVAEMSARDADFRRWWQDHRVGRYGTGRKTFRHADVGELTLDWSNLTSTADPGQHLVTFTAEPGSVSHDRLQALARNLS
jgi:transcriptional regulator with XRE-family HTH domain